MNEIKELKAVNLEETKVYSIDEQIELIKRSLMGRNAINSIVFSLTALKQTINCDLKYFVAVMNPDDYSKFIEFLNLKTSKNE